MTLYGYELFNRYWKKFELYKIINGEKIKNNPYSYFYKMIVRAYFNILKNYQKNNYENYLMFPNEDLEIFNNKNNNNYDNNKTTYNELVFKNNDVIYDINIISYTLLNDFNLTTTEHIINSLNTYLFNKEAIKFIKNDKSFNEIFNLLKE